VYYRIVSLRKGEGKDFSPMVVVVIRSWAGRAGAVKRGGGSLGYDLILRLAASWNPAARWPRCRYCWYWRHVK
jgi:hypothetical protein